MTLQHLALVFPGQGSQKVGMLAELAEQFSVVKDTFSEASDVLGYDLWQLVQEGEQEALNQTEKTQPALLTSSVAIWRVWNEQGGAAPALLAGHSLGEFSALVCSGVISFADGVSLVQQRGAFMQSAVPAGEGAMAAIIGLSDEQINEACETAAQGQVVNAVNYNSPGQVVIAGHTDALNRAMENCKAMGAKRAMPLAVSAPFHTALMKPAAEKLAEKIQATTFNVPNIPIVHNVTSATEQNPEAIKSLMVEQMYSPVLWTSSVEKMVADGITATVECGPGKVLCGLNKRIHKPLQGLPTETPDMLAKAVQDVAEA